MRYCRRVDPFRIVKLLSSSIGRHVDLETILSDMTMTTFTVDLRK